VKEKTIDYFKTISIPGISKITTTNNLFLKLSWILLIFIVFALGFWNICLAITDYYHYDKITKVERVAPSIVTFPAITICSKLRKVFFVDGILLNSLNDTSLSLKNFINWKYTYFHPSTNLSGSEHLEYFEITPDLDCLRFNGIKNKNIELLKANKTENYFRISFNNSYTESISKNNYFTFTIVNEFRVYIADNYLNSFDKLEPYMLEKNRRYNIEMVKETVEIKLPEPFNQCKESLSIKPYHQSNCIDTCLYREIREKHNCTFLWSLYSFDGLKQCDNLITFYKKEF